MRLIDKSSKVPLYVQLVQVIKKMIETGELTESGPLMSEREICKVQKVSRMTVNKAILQLVNEGVLIRQQGKGTFVAPEKRKNRYENLEGLSEMMEKRGLQLKNELLAFEVLPFPKEVVEKLKMESDSGYKVKRIRYIEGEPVILEVIYLNPEMCPGLNESLVKKHSLYELYQEKYHHTLKRAEQVIKPVLLSQEEGKLLEQPKNTLALNIDRVVYTAQESVMEYTISIFLSQKHDFEVVLHQV